MANFGLIFKLALRRPNLNKSKTTLSRAGNSFILSLSHETVRLPLKIRVSYVSFKNLRSTITDSAYRGK